MCYEFGYRNIKIGVLGKLVSSVENTDRVRVLIGRPGSLK